MSIETDIQKLSPGNMVTLYELDATAIGGVINRFHEGLNEVKQSVTWQGNVYQAIACKAVDFELTGKGTLPRPKVSVSNIGGLIGQMALQYDDLVGAKFTRKRTLVKYLDAMNFTGGVNPTADPNAYFPDDIYIVNRKVKDDNISVDFELASPMDVDGVMLPRRQIIQNVCAWTYRSSECSYAGGPVAKIDDTPTALSDEDVCGKRLASCKLRFGTYGELPYGGFPGAGLIR